VRSRVAVSVLFSEPKIPQSAVLARTTQYKSVSVLFSEPKIPQWRCCLQGTSKRQGFSALQRAENSSISCATALDIKQHLFQCSSASRKFLNASPRLGVRWSPRVSVLFSEPKIPQSFFLTSLTPHRQRGFSALQRAENSSMRARYAAANVCAIVSVLFSEPKIPQSTIRLAAWMYRQRFSALQRAENSSMALLLAGNIKAPRFQCSSASRKFLNRNPADVDR